MRRAEAANANSECVAMERTAEAHLMPESDDPCDAQNVIGATGGIETKLDVLASSTLL